MSLLLPLLLSNESKTLGATLTLLRERHLCRHTGLPLVAWRINMDILPNNILLSIKI